MPDKRPVKDSLSIRWIRLRRRIASHPLVRIAGGGGAATLLLGAALSAGGLTTAVDGAHFLVEKNLDSLRVVRQDRAGSHVVARIDDAFAANSLFKLSRALPDSIVSRRLALFDDQWLNAPQEKRDVFDEEMARINAAIRRQFFANAMPYGDIIHQKSAKYDVDPVLVAAVIEQESRFRTSARSHVGAQGLMQLMPRTGRWMGARNLYDAEENIDAGVKYIKYLQKRFGGDLKNTVAAYNAGEGNVRRYNGVPPFRETETYVRKVLGNYHRRNRELERFGQELAENRGDGAR